MPCSVLEIFAKSEEAKRNAINQNYTDYPQYSGYAPFTFEKDKFTRAIDDIHPIPDPSNLGDLALERWSDTRDLNLFQPQGEYEITEIEQLATGLPDPGDIEDTASVKYFEDILMNAYYDEERVSVDIPIATPSLNRYGNYNDRAQIFRALDNRNIVDIFFGVPQQNDSELGNIAADALRESLQNNFEENLLTMTFGRLNTRLFDLYREQTLIKKDFEITVNPNPVGRAVEILQRLQGVSLPFSYCPPNLQGLYGDNGFSAQERAALIFDYTGKATKGIIKASMDRNEFRPFIEDRNSAYTVLPNYYLLAAAGEQINNFEFNAVFSGDDLAAFGDTPGDAAFYDYYGVPFISKDQSQLNNEIISSTSNILTISDELLNGWEAIDWTDSSINKFSPKSLLYRTKQLAIERGNDVFIDSFKKEFLLKKNGEEHRLSKGSGITSKSSFTLQDDVATVIPANDYFRAYHKGFRYNQLARALRHRTLDSGEKRTVLGDNGIPYYMPTIKTDDSGTELIKRTFFSLENLAWKNNIGDLPPCERGNPDVNGNIGRWMAFPPYNLKFNESVNVNLNAIDFMARGEKIYTYNNTARTGTISFSMIVDHPDSVNKVRGKYSHLWERYFQGDKGVESEVRQIVASRLTPSERNELEKLRKPPQINKKNVPDEIVPENKKEEIIFENSEQLRNWVISNGENIASVFFPNEASNLPAQISGAVNRNAGYESDRGGTYSLPPTDPLFYTYNDKGIRIDNVNFAADPYENRDNYSLNASYYGINEKLNSYLNSLLSDGTKSLKVYVFGSASRATSTRISNSTLAERRASNVMNWFKERLQANGAMSLGIDITYDNPQGFSDELDSLSNEESREDEYGAKFARRAEIWVVKGDDSTDEPAPQNDPNEIFSFQDVGDDPQYNTDFDEFTSTVAPELSPELYEKLFYSECDWFEEIKITDPLTYNTISEKVKHFHPAYHSLSPSTFHKRLTFLHQCTRQGGSAGLDGGRPNLAFGTQPLLKLMIGDFFYTYIMIESMSINYDLADGNITWDTNPEGIGVQPMFCNVEMQVVVLGSQSLSSPISRLNNALSFNYYANTSSYDARANDVVFTTNGSDNQFSTEIVEGLRLSEVYNTDRNLVNQDLTKNLIEFRNVSREDLNSDPNTLEAIDNTDLEIDDLRDVLGLKPVETYA